jgi:EAL domain-containing protein (putative c-di-GMP-specific phosphodiesterase class I)
LKTVAEGVESLAQVNQLDAIGCDSWQGYYFAMPLDVDGIDNLLRQPAEQQRGTARRLKLAS